MTAAILTHPAGATRIERAALRTTARLTRWITARADRRTERHAAMLRAVHARQVAPRDPRAITYDLACRGIVER